MNPALLSPTAGHRPAPVHPGTCGPEVSQYRSLEPRRDYSLQHAERGPRPSAPRGRAPRARLSPSLPRPREGACAIRGPRARTPPCNCNSASPRCRWRDLSWPKLDFSQTSRCRGTRSRRSVAMPPRADPPGWLAPPFPRPAGVQCRQGARAQAARVGRPAPGRGLALGAGPGPGTQPELSDG